MKSRDLHALLRQEPHPARRAPVDRPGRDRQPARQERRRALHHGQGRSWAMVHCRGLGQLQGRGDRRAARPTEIAHKGLGYVPENRDIFPTLTVRQNLLLGQKRGQGSRALEHGGHVRALPAPEGAHRHPGRRALGRRAADAHAVPHADGRPRPGHDRRADRGPGAEDRRAGGASCSWRSSAAACRSCWSSRSSPSRSRSPSACTSWGTAASCSRARRRTCRSNAAMRKEWLEV